MASMLKRRKQAFTLFYHSVSWRSFSTDFGFDIS